MEAQSKPKTPRKLAVRLKRSKPKEDDGGMVVFPTASGKLATTWIKNVDNIISEGTGNISFDRLCVMKEKLETALGLISSRLTEMSVNKIKAESDKYVMDKLNHFIKNCVGTVVRLRNRERRFNQGNAGSRSLLVSKACIQDGKRLCMGAGLLGALHRERLRGLLVSLQSPPVHPGQSSTSSPVLLSRQLGF